MPAFVRVSSCVMNQWALDFEGNLRRIVRSVEEARAAGARLRLGSELEIPGYGCQDHFLEPDTFLHSWEVLVELLRRSKEDWADLLLVTSMPVLHRSVAYNCQLFLLDGKILLIRPKKAMCDDGNYRESRWFAAWRRAGLEEHVLPKAVASLSGQTTAPFGEAVLETADTAIGCETCEELWTAQSTSVAMSQDGVEVLLNASGSHFELRKSAYQLDSLIRGQGEKLGGLYVFANQRGCPGGRLYYDGSATIALNGSVRARAAQFGLKEVEVMTATLDLDEVRAFRQRIRSSQVSAAGSVAFPRVNLRHWALGSEDLQHSPVSSPLAIRAKLPEEEIAQGPAAWLWDYLRRSGQSGFMVPLSGGRDSAAVVTIVYSMCRLVAANVREGVEEVIADARRLCGPDVELGDAKALCGRLLSTVYMGTDNSSRETRQRAKDLAEQIGAAHWSVSMDEAVAGVMGTFTKALGKAPNYTVQGGSARENLALQNVQARVRMVTAYVWAQLGPWAEGRPGGLLVLATGNVDEGLRGYLTKYDCSSGDLNPIGSISKMDLDGFLRYAMGEWGLDSLASILDASPTAELVPLDASGAVAQTDEAEMGMTYRELSTFGRLRLPGSHGPLSMFLRLRHEWAATSSPEEVAQKVKHFFRCYAMNRHKATVSTPALHCEAYSPDDHRHDHRPFLYNVAWPWQFAQIDRALEGIKRGQ